MFYKAMLKKKNSKKAFTLIELIVVIAIIGVLIAILVPTMNGFVSEARDTANLANARTGYSIAAAAQAQLETSGEAIDAAALVSEINEQMAGQMSGSFSATIGDNGMLESVTYTPGEDEGGTAQTYPSN